MARRIIPVSSGKGGVGKTTFALNFALALSRAGSTILVDLDTGTSSVRNTLSVEVDKDLYHFWRKGVPLAECVTRLGKELDPHSRFPNFGFIAAPKHFIDDLANPSRELRFRIAQAINHLPVEYVIVDLRAGLDPQVLDFLPYTNTGILVFAPDHPAANLAASDIVKASLFRSLRVLFAPNSRFFQQGGLHRYHGLVNELLNQVEDVYDDSLPNLDAFLLELEEAFGDHPILGVLADTIDSFRVYYVLNMFNGVERGYREAIVPFVKNLSENVTTGLNLTQLGWIVHDPKVHAANCKGLPILLDRPAAPRRAERIDPVMDEIKKLESTMLGIKRVPRQRARSQRRRRNRSFDLVQTDDLLADQLTALRAMYSSRPKRAIFDNFAYITQRVLNLMGPDMSVMEFGHTKMGSSRELRVWFGHWQRAHGMMV